MSGTFLFHKSTLISYLEIKIMKRVPFLNKGKNNQNWYRTKNVEEKNNVGMVAASNWEQNY